mmetsp:Transcript_103552/g.292800  ORF Transcript_103552/g.292800 Transcript_103552/m.292800 type:complete len:367 (+) Transcript_103552:383-1483(+)
MNQLNGSWWLHSGHLGSSSLLTQTLWKWCLQGVVTTTSMSRGSEQREQYMVPSSAKASPVEASCSHWSFCALPMSCFSCGDLCGSVLKKSPGTGAELPVAPPSCVASCAPGPFCGRCSAESASRALTSSPTTSLISRSDCSPSCRASCSAASPPSVRQGPSLGKYVCRKRVRMPSELGTPAARATSSTAPSAGWDVSVRQMGHCVILYSPGWNAIGPSTKHFQQKRWLHDSWTVSEIVSRQMGHCCGSRSGCGRGGRAAPGSGASSESTSMWPSDSMAACSSAKSEPLKKLCLDSQAARSAAVSSRPKCVCFRRFFRIFTTATAFQTAYFRNWSTSPRISTRRRNASGRAAGPAQGTAPEAEAEAP